MLHLVQPEIYLCAYMFCVYALSVPVEAALLALLFANSKCNEEMFCFLFWYSCRFLKSLEDKDLAKAQLGLAHSYSRAKVKFNVNKADNMIIQVQYCFILSYFIDRSSLRQWSFLELLNFSASQLNRALVA